MYSGELHEKSFVEKLADINKTISLIKKESKINSFGYFDYHKIAKKVPKKELSKIDEIIKTIIKKGYSASRTHFSNTSIKTDMKIKSFMNILKR